jgi:Zn-dependent M28 family amino/carboxypeptidase
MAKLRPRNRVRFVWWGARETALGGSDHAPFAVAGIPVGGLFTGADGQKS